MITNSEVSHEGRRLLRLHRSPKQVEIELRKRWSDKAPDIRTIQNWAKAERLLMEARETMEPAENWSLASGDPDDARLILPVLRAVTYASDGHVAGFTVAEAEWIARVRRALPDIPPIDAYHLAMDHIYEPPESLPNLALWAAFGGWIDDDLDELVRLVEVSALRRDARKRWPLGDMVSEMWLASGQGERVFAALGGGNFYRSEGEERAAKAARRKGNGNE